MKEPAQQAYITSAAHSALINHCLTALPLEACGLLAASSSSSSIDSLYPIRNIDSQPETGFTFDPAQWTEAFFNMQKNQQKLVGFYHSHPQTAAIPSVRDVNGIIWGQTAAYWIISLVNVQSPIIQPYIQRNGSFIPVPLVLT